MKYTLCTDLYEFDGCAIVVKHDALKFFLKKQARDEETGEYISQENPSAKEIESIIMMEVM